MKPNQSFCSNLLSLSLKSPCPLIKSTSAGSLGTGCTTVWPLAVEFVAWSLLAEFEEMIGLWLATTAISCIGDMMLVVVMFLNTSASQILLKRESNCDRPGEIMYITSVDRRIHINAYHTQVTSIYINTPSYFYNNCFIIDLDENLPAWA